MHLYGSYTSPYVRRVRILAEGLGVPYEMSDVATEAGQAAMRAVNPLWRVPTAVFGPGDVVWDSQAILVSLVRRHGWGAFRPAADADREANLVNAINGALDSAVNVFYLKKDGVDVGAVPYLVKQRARVDAAMGWVEAQLRDDASFVDGRPGFAELALFTTLGWMRFRDTWPVAAHPALAHFHDRWEAEPGWQASAPR